MKKKIIEIRIFDHARRSKKVWARRQDYMNRLTKDKNFELRFNVKRMKAGNMIFGVPYTIKSERDGEMLVYRDPNLDWFREEFSSKATDFDVVVADYTTRHVNKFGKSDLGGYMLGMYKGVSEIYMHSPTEREWKRRFVHELSHAVFRNLMKKHPWADLTHKMDYEEGDVTKAIEHWNLRSYIPMKDRKGVIASIFLKIQELQKQLNKLKEGYRRPLNEWMPSFNFGEPAPYLSSGIHNGTDFLVPIGTPVYAPADGEITLTRRLSTTAGNYCFFKFGQYGMRCLHLLSEPVKGKYKKGEIIAYTGSTGLSINKGQKIYDNDNKTGVPHIHIEIWRGDYDIRKIMTAKGVREHLIDPIEFFSPKVGK